MTIKGCVRVIPLLFALTACGLPVKGQVMNTDWPATDALGRKLPGYAECGPPRQRYVAMFYFLWHGPHVTGGPFDVTRILDADPTAMSHPESKLWGPLYAPHHWGQSIFGYYLADDAYVLRRHAQMLAAAGVDTVVFDTTNQLSYPHYYQALLKAWSDVRAQGGATPQVAFLTPFWAPRKVVGELWHDLYAPGLHPDLWFRWHGKPLILADPALLDDSVGATDHDTPAKIEPGHTVGQSFTADSSLQSVAGSFPTYRTTGAALTLRLRRDGPQGAMVAERRFTNVIDNDWLTLPFDPPQPKGVYYLEAIDPTGEIGWWMQAKGTRKGVQAYLDGQPTTGLRDYRLGLTTDLAAQWRSFFTFRKPQADYFVGPTGPDQWSWLEVYPQHVFRNSAGEKEQMSVGVAQNAVGGRLGSMSEKDAKGRSWHNGARDTRPDAVRYGLNFAEQWDRALAEDPQIVFVTGWNEWFAGRYGEFAGVKEPVMFVDEFDQEHSRDIEPMEGGHGDDYYWQLVSYVRRYKGVPKPTAASAARTMRLDGPWSQWDDVTPEYHADAGAGARRDHDGWNKYTHFSDASGRNEPVLAKVARDADHLYFYVRCAQPLSPSSDPQWMMLFLSTGRAPGWEGYDFVVDRTVKNDHTGVLEANAGGFEWRAVADVPLRVEGRELMLAIPRAALGVSGGKVRMDFKWADNTGVTGDVLAFWRHGDAAPPARFNYCYESGD